MTRKSLMLIAALGSLALLLGAFAFELAGYAPCKLCIWQRWPHGVAIVAGAIVVFVGPWLLLSVIGALGAAASAGLGIYHTGVERGWWEGPSSCSGAGNGLSGLSGGDLLSTDITTPVVMCDEVAWAFAGLSMASWNAVFSMLLVAVWIMALRRP